LTNFSNWLRRTEAQEKNIQSLSRAVRQSPFFACPISRGNPRPVRRRALAKAAQD